MANVIDTIGKAIALKFVERAATLELRGQRRDEAAVDFFCGAAIALDAAGLDVEAKTIAAVVQLMVSTEGYDGVRRMAEGE
jgi:hypothetical protein